MPGSESAEAAGAVVRLASHRVPGQRTASVIVPMIQTTRAAGNHTRCLLARPSATSVCLAQATLPVELAASHAVRHGRGTTKVGRRPLWKDSGHDRADL